MMYESPFIEMFGICDNDLEAALRRFKKAIDGENLLTYTWRKKNLDDAFKKKKDKDELDSAPIVIQVPASDIRFMHAYIIGSMVSKFNLDDYINRTSGDRDYAEADFYSGRLYDCFIKAIEPLKEYDCFRHKEYAMDDHKTYRALLPFALLAVNEKLVIQLSKVIFNTKNAWCMLNALSKFKSDYEVATYTSTKRTDIVKMYRVLEQMLDNAKTISK